MFESNVMFEVRVPRNPATAPTPTETYVIGTSLTRGLGKKLQSCDVNASTFTYAGATLPIIRSRVSHILPSNLKNKPINIILQCGGNDCEMNTEDQVIDEYEGLIKDVRRQCPASKILLSTIPPRKNDKDVLTKIQNVNDYLRDRGLYRDNVNTIDVTPKSYEVFFNKDQVHFNDRGLSLYAKNMQQELLNFTRRPSQPHI